MKFCLEIQINCSFWVDFFHAFILILKKHNLFKFLKISKFWFITFLLLDLFVLLEVPSVRTENQISYPFRKAWNAKCFECEFSCWQYNIFFAFADVPGGLPNSMVLEKYEKGDQQHFAAFLFLIFFFQFQNNNMQCHKPCGSLKIDKSTYIQYKGKQQQLSENVLEIFILTRCGWFGFFSLVTIAMVP